jgi:hypothetical protein
MENKKNISQYASGLYNQSIIESEDFPLDKDYLLKKLDNIQLSDYRDFLVYNLNNLPPVYNIRFMLLTIDRYMIYLNELDWIYIHKSLLNRGAVNTIVSYYNSYLGLSPNQILLIETKFNNTIYIYEKDDDDFIERNYLQNSVMNLRTKMLKTVFFDINK